jgi:hypothetical protein
LFSLLYQDRLPLNDHTATLESQHQDTEIYTRPSVANRLGPRWLNHLRALFGTPSRRRLAQAALRVDRIRYWEQEYNRLSDDEVRQRGRQLRGRARGGESLDQLLPEVFGLVFVAAVRTVKLRPS